MELKSIENQTDKNSILQKEILKLFLKKGMRNVTINQITDNFGISSKTLYKEYGDKRGLIDSCIELYLKNSAEILAEILKENTDNLELIITAYFLYVDNLSKTNDLFFSDLNKFYINDEQIDEFYGYENMLTFIKYGKDKSVLLSTIDEALVSKSLILLIRSYFQFGNKKLYSVESKVHFFNNVMKPFIVGICSDRYVAKMNALDISSKVNKLS